MTVSLQATYAIQESFITHRLSHMNIQCTYTDLLIQLSHPKRKTSHFEKNIRNHTFNYLILGIILLLLFKTRHLFSGLKLSWFQPLHSFSVACKKNIKWHKVIQNILWEDQPAMTIKLKWQRVSLFMSQFLFFKFLKGEKKTPEITSENTKPKYTAIHWKNCIIIQLCTRVLFPN